MKDVTAPENIQIVISADGKTVWINDENKCVFRACNIGKVTLEDNRRK